MYQEAGGVTVEVFEGRASQQGGAHFVGYVPLKPSSVTLA
jgi:hypothetical protein